MRLLRPFVRLYRWLRPAKAPVVHVPIKMFPLPGTSAAAVARYCRERELIIRDITFDIRPLPGRREWPTKLITLRCERSADGREELLHFWTDDETLCRRPSLVRTWLKDAEPGYFGRYGLPQIRNVGEPTPELAADIHSFLTGLRPEPNRRPMLPKPNPAKTPNDLNVPEAELVRDLDIEAFRIKPREDSK